MRATRLMNLLLCSVVTVAAVPALAAGLQPHRAVYDLSLADGGETGTITGIDGRMVYEFRGSACEGYTVSFRYVTRFETEQTSQLIDERSETFESGDGSAFRFETSSFIDENLDRETRGEAVATGDGIEVDIAAPEAKAAEVAPALFPTEHLLDLIARAEAGETFYEEKIYDGSDGGEKPMTTTVVIGQAAETAGDDPESAALQGRGQDAYWPVDMAYFDLATGNATGEELPTYHISFKLHESGLTRDLMMDYGQFAIAGRLVELEMLEADEGCAE